MAGRGRYKDITGTTFNSWTVVTRAGSSKSGALWACECACGKRKVISTNDLTSGHTTSCGCLRGIHRHTANHATSPTYRSWWNMVSRCTVPSSPSFKHYKKRGITLCKRWRDFASFLADMGERPAGNYTLDRIDNAGNYEPGNVRWATKQEQANNRVTNIFFEWRGTTYTLANLSRACGVEKELLRSRLCRGKYPWTVEGAIKTPKLTRREQGFYC